MTGSLFLTISAALVFTALIMMLRQLLLLPVRCGKNTESFYILKIFSSEPGLENNLRSLIWLRENSVLKAQIIILAIALDEQTKQVAEDYASNYKSITLIQDGEISQWIKNLSC